MKVLPVYNLSGLSAIAKNEFVLTQFAPYLKIHHKLHIPHGHSFYHIVLFTRGTGKHTIDFTQFDIKPFQIYFMIPGQVHHWEFDGEVDGYVLNFSTSFFQSFLLQPDYLEEFPFFQGTTNTSVIDIPTGKQSKILSLFEEMLVVNSSTSNHDHLKALILHLFFSINDCTHIDPENRVGSHQNLTIVRNFKKLIDKNYLKLKLPHEYANLLFVTPNHLNALCSQMLGISAGQLVRQRILLEAKRLLVNMELPISEIAYQLNFNDNSYFTKFFKKQAGCTPEEFRKQMSAK